MKNEIDKEIENEIINFKIEKNKEVLLLKNQLIEKVEEKIEEKFNQYLNQNIEKIILDLLIKLQNSEVKILVPENIDINIGKQVRKEKNIKNKFLIEGEKWDIEFSWEDIKKTIGRDLKKEIAKKLFNGKEKRN